MHARAQTRCAFVASAAALTPGADATSLAGGSSGIDAKCEPYSDAQCPPSFLRMSYNCFPNSRDLQTTASVPFGAVFHPLSPDQDVPLVNFGRMAIPRCRACRAYINPFVTWIENGRRWRCNFCNLANEVAADYLCGLRDGERTDRAKRAELRSGLVEFAAPSEYMVRAPQPSIFVFLLDVSYASVVSGVLASTAHAIKLALDDMAELPRAKFALFTFDDHVHYYTFPVRLCLCVLFRLLRALTPVAQSGGSSAQMRVMCDVDEPFAAAPTRVVTKLSESRDAIDELLDAVRASCALRARAHAVFCCARTSCRACLPAHVSRAPRPVPRSSAPTWRRATSAASCYSIRRAAWRPAWDACRRATSAPAIRTHCCCQTVRARARAQPRSTHRARAESTSEFYKTFALDCSRAQLSVDVNLFGQQFTDVASFNTMPQLTGGELRKYEWPFTAEQVANDLERCVTRETGLEAVMRVRCSKGLSVSAHHGNLFVRSTDLLALPNVDADKAFVVQLKSEGLASRRTASLQAALLYTTAKGQRRIRVMTVCLPVVNKLADIFKYADQHAVVNIMTKMAIKKALDSNLADAREALVNKVGNAAHSRRRLCWRSFSPHTDFRSALTFWPCIDACLPRRKRRPANWCYPKRSSCCRCACWR